jgi:WD40 repeat protein
LPETFIVASVRAGFLNLPFSRKAFMKPQTIFQSFILLCLTSLVALPLMAQQGDCLPRVVLPPATEANIFSQEQEVWLGEAVAEHIQKNYHIIEDLELTAALTRLGERLHKHLPLAKMQFQFFLVDLPDANAFVLPGGRIYVSRKLVALAQSEDELAGVIGHELGHLAAREQSINVTRLFKELIGVTEVRDRRDIFEKYNQMIENVGRKPGALKTGEREKGQLIADQLGFYALVSAGYEPAALARFWDRATETRGKKGNFFSDLFGTTRPEERRLREMLKAVAALPAACAQTRTLAPSAEFKQWQSSVINYTGLGRREALHGVISKQQLQPPLRSDITHLRFSPDGKYVLAQDDAGINVLSREPFEPLFRIEAADANPAAFTPDSQSIIFYTPNLRVERWSVAEGKLSAVKEIVVFHGCLQTELSPDGKFLACLTPKFDLNLLDVASGQPSIHKKDFFTPDYYHYLRILARLITRGDESSDLGLHLLNMGFSPDGHYFAAGYYGRTAFRRAVGDDNAEAFDLTTLNKVSLPDSIRRRIGGGFTFAGNDRIVGVNNENAKKSGVVEFPSGKTISEFPLYHKNLTAPTRGNYLFIRPMKEFAMGVMDLSTGTVFKVNQQPALDIYDDVFVAEMRNGQLGLYRVEKNVLLATALLSNNTLGRLHVAELSPDMKWLALSGRSRGGVWNLNKGEAALYLRGFRGGYLSDDGFLYADFPKYQEAERNVAKFNLRNGDIVQGPKLEEDAYVIQAGPYLAVTKGGTVKPAEGEPVEWGSKTAVFEMRDARNMTSLLWSKTYPKETPRVWLAPQQGTVALVWNVTDEAARIEIKNDARLGSQLAAMQEKEGDYFLQILDAQSGNELGRLLIETGKGSFRLSHVYATGDWVVVADTQNRVLLYSLKSGQLKGRVFGGYATISPVNNLLCVENESGKLALYDINTMEKRDELVFSSPVSLVRFSSDGKLLFVLTSNQTAYTLATANVGNNTSAVKQD